MPDLIRGSQLIGGTWQTHRADLVSTSPADGLEIGRFPIATPREVQDAIGAARAAFPSWRRTSRIHRAECFDRLAKLIAREVDSLAEIMARECGKVLPECRAEVIEGLHMVQYVFGTGRMPIGEIVASEIEDKDAFIRRKPWGVVGVITPWNFPFAVPLWMLGPSLLEGNTAVFKPSEDTPAIGQRLVELFLEAGFPPGVLNLVHGAAETGEAIVQDPRVNVILFTGSSAVGQHIQQVSAKLHDRIVAAEMGGKNAVIVCEDARFDLAINAAILSAFKTTGQRCVSASRIIVHDSLMERFATRFVEVAKRLKFGHSLEAGNFAGPMIHRAALEKVQRHNELAKQEGAQVLLDCPEPAQGSCFLAPFVYQVNHDPKLKCLQEEAFGPHVALIPFRTQEEAAIIANGTDYGLSLAVITESYRNMRFFREECEFGLGYVNLPSIGAEVHLPFGGVKKSGNGHPSAAGLVDTVTHKIAWTVNHGLDIRMAQGLTAEV